MPFKWNAPIFRLNEHKVHVAILRQQRFHVLFKAVPCGEQAGCAVEKQYLAFAPVVGWQLDPADPLAGLSGTVNAEDMTGLNRKLDKLPNVFDERKIDRLAAGWQL